MEDYRLTETEIKDIREQERQPLKTQTYVLSKKRFKTVTQANKWMDDNDVPRPKVDETDTSFRYRQFDPDRCQVGSFRSTTITDGVTITGCRLKPEFRESLKEQQDFSEVEFPVNSRGLSVSGTLSELSRRVLPYTKQESGFKDKATDVETVCGSCRFYLRNPSGSALGECQIVEGVIAWFATCDFYISARDEAIAVFRAEEEMPAQLQMEESDRHKSEFKISSK